MKHRKLPILVLLLILLLSSSCVEMISGGQDEEIILTPGSFSSVVVKGMYDIVLCPDTRDAVIIRGGKNTGDTRAYLIGDTLVIKDRSGLSAWPGRNTAEIHFRNLDYLLTIYPCGIRCTDTIRSEKFELCALGEIQETELLLNCGYTIIYSSNSLGSINVAGKTEYGDLSARYGCSLSAQNFICGNAEVYSSSIRDTRVNVVGFLKVHLMGKGNIIYHGSPDIQVAAQSGKGRLIRAE